MSGAIKQRTLNMFYTGQQKISAVKAVRWVTSLGLKECKEAIEAPYFLVTEVQCLAIIGAYYLEEAEYDRGCDVYKDWTRSVPERGVPDLSEAN